MKILLRIVLVLVAIIALLAIIALFLPSKVSVARSATINSKPEAVFAMVNDFKKWSEWSPWDKLDPNMKKTWGEKTEGAGASYAWESDVKNVGKGSMSITESTPSSKITTEMHFMDRGKPATGTFTFEPEGDKTKMTWSMDADMGMNLIGRYFGLMMDKMVGPDFEKGIKNIDSVLAAMPKEPEVVYNVQEVAVTSFPALTILDSADMKDVSTKYASMYQEIGTYMGKNKLQMTGPVFGIINSYTPERLVWEAGAHLNKPGNSSGRIVAKDTYGGQAAKVDYYGDYMKVGSAYDALDKWMKENKKDMNGFPWEVYVTDPGAEKDTAKWLTEIYYPIK